ncbi:hypothetical protein OKW76_12155 [Sphingomonas sp. S1-29]|uniref:hypothetical protein n=1 Tax=Sphingomonas sp. S1-29 TaxID=2991074 RepID=UPI00223F1D63|nr:hypothetical protein [Sphingomonas sp. S1-29]UZK68787.1 hypothetical protein OKW76_12155 [Sphingomonas sp. S1-29]
MHFIPTMISYVVLVFLVPAVIEASGASGPVLWLLAALPALPLVSVFWLICRLLVELDDEYLRMLEVRKALVATGFSMAFASVWGFLEIYAGAAHLPMFFVPIAWFAGLGLGSLVNAVVEPQA